MSIEEESKTTFSMTHISMSLKYGGISFIAGAVSHGVFSGQRSFVTALLGLLAFMLGTWLENRDSQQVKGELLKALAISSLLGVSLGFFTGSLQHFPNSPFRSVWVVPVGFLLSLIALALSHNKPITASVKRYAAISFAVVLIGSLSAYGYYSQNPVAGGHGGHDHGEVATKNTADEHDHSQHDHEAMVANTKSDKHDDKST